jgi:hypothetical protein
MSFGAAAEETVTYTHKDDTSFYGVVGSNTHATNAHVEIAYDANKGYGAASTMNGAHFAFGNSITYFDTGGSPTVSEFPASGSLLLSEGLAEEETVPYTSRTATLFSGIPALANNHADGASIQTANGVTMRSIKE